MKILVDIDEELLKEALRLSRAKTKKELVNFSLKELIRHEHIERLKSKMGSFKFNLNLRKLERMRK
jgi:Arc/MetJ family transcription regulator